jgi:hypothetical protein
MESTMQATQAGRARGTSIAAWQTLAVAAAAAAAALYVVAAGAGDVGLVAWLLALA